MVGLDPRSGMRPQLLIPGVPSTPCASYPGRLVGPCWPAPSGPGWSPDVEHGDIDALVRAYPDFREQIHAFAG